MIVYAYLNKVYSGKKMERLLVENIAFMWLSGIQTPDFRTINLFRSKRLAGKFDDIAHYRKFITILLGTEILMKEIDM